MHTNNSEWLWGVIIANTPAKNQGGQESVILEVENFIDSLGKTKTGLN